MSVVLDAGDEDSPFKKSQGLSNLSKDSNKKKEPLIDLKPTKRPSSNKDAKNLEEI